MAKLVKMTSNIDLSYWPQPPSFRVWPPILKHVKNNTTFKFHSDYFGVLNVEIGSEMAKLVKMTSNIDLDLLASVFDLRFWNIWRGTHIYFSFRVFWRIKRWNRLINGQVSEIDLQYWPRPPSFRVWPPILKHVKKKPHLNFISIILAY